MSLAAAPDLIERVVGFRAWRVIDDRLLSPYIPCRWEGRMMHAECWPANRSLTKGRGWLNRPPWSRLATGSFVCPRTPKRPPNCVR